KRRLAGSVLMAVFAGLLAGSLTFLEDPAGRLAEEGEAAREHGQQPVLDPEQKQFIHFYGGYWIVMLLVLLALVALAAFDLLATRRFGLRQYRKIQTDRRAMIERQAARLRQERNGPGGLD